MSTRKKTKGPEIELTLTGSLDSDGNGIPDGTAKVSARNLPFFGDIEGPAITVNLPIEQVLGLLKEHIGLDVNDLLFGKRK